MVAINIQGGRFDATQVKPNTVLEAIPSGLYAVQIVASEEKPTKKGNGSYIELKMEVLEGDYVKRSVFDRLNTNNQNEQAVEIAYSTLSAICHVTGKLNIQDTAQLHGIPFKVLVSKVPRDDKPDQFSNEIKGYKDMQGNDPGFGGKVASSAAEPDWAANSTTAEDPAGDDPDNVYTDEDGNVYDLVDNEWVMRAKPKLTPPKPPAKPATPAKPAAKPTPPKPGAAKPAAAEAAADGDAPPWLKNQG